MNTIHYKLYRAGSGRDQFIKKAWGSDRDYKVSKTSSRDTNTIEPSSLLKFKKPPPSELKKKLTLLQYRVTQENGTEPPYANSYWNNKKMYCPRS